MTDERTDASRIRWGEETQRTAHLLGWSVIRTDGIADYQGWGVHLLCRTTDAATRMVAMDAAEEQRVDVAIEIHEQPTTEWAVMSWDYGSCGGCDSYEDKFGYRGAEEPDSLYLELWAELVEPCTDEMHAREQFSAKKGW